MLDVPLGSRSHLPRRLGGLITSVVLHAVLISAAAALARPLGEGASAPRSTVPPVTYIAPPSVEQYARGERRLGRTPITPGTPRFQPPEIALPDEPAIELSGPATDDRVSCSDYRGPTIGTQIGSGVVDGPSIAPGIRDEREVDRQPRLVAGQPIEPRYPAALRESGVQGSVLVRFVVDTVGRVDLGSLQIIQSPHPLFAAAVQEVLAHCLFVPGEAGGRRVSTRVQIPFEFRLR